MSELILTEDNFQSEVLTSKIPILVDFWAAWCGPCRGLAPLISEIAETYQGKVKVGKVNVDQVPSLAADYQVQSIPTLILFHEGKSVDRSTGIVPRERIVEMFSSLL